MVLHVIHKNILRLARFGHLIACLVLFEVILLLLVRYRNLAFEFCRIDDEVVDLCRFVSFAVFGFGFLVRNADSCSQQALQFFAENFVSYGAFKLRNRQVVLLEHHLILRAANECAILDEHRNCEDLVLNFRIGYLQAEASRFDGYHFL